MTDELDLPMTAAHPRAAAMLDAYRLFLNYYSDERDPATAFSTLDEFISDPDIAATLTITPIDYYRNAIAIHMNYDTCDIDLIATFDERDNMTSIICSTDTMPYEPMILDLNRK
jgi:hypothetical protein